MEKTQLLEDKKLSIILPYNTPLKRIFDTDNFDVVIIEKNGQDPLVIVKYKTEQN